MLTHLHNVLNFALYWAVSIKLCPPFMIEASSSEDFIKNAVSLFKCQPSQPDIQLKNLPQQPKLWAVPTHH